MSNQVSPVCRVVNLINSPSLLYYWSYSNDTLTPLRLFVIRLLFVTRLGLILFQGVNGEPHRMGGTSQAPPYVEGNRPQVLEGNKKTIVVVSSRKIGPRWVKKLGSRRTNETFILFLTYPIFTTYIPRALDGHLTP